MEWHSAAEVSAGRSEVLHGEKAALPHGAVKVIELLTAGDA